MSPCIQAFLTMKGEAYILSPLLTEDHGRASGTLL